MEKFCDRLKQLREEAGLSMKQVADAIEVSDAAVCKWENGNAEPKVTYIIKLSEFFDCTADYLIGKNNDFGVAEKEKSIILTQREKGLIASFRLLSPNMKKLVCRTMDAWSAPDGEDE